MTHISLKRLLARQKEAAAVVHAVIAVIGAPVCIQDGEGNVLAGFATDGCERHPVTCEGGVIGWTSGQQQAELVATLLTYLANKEAEKATLADETLERYRELNLLYHLSEKLAASLELAAVAQTAMDEASRLIKATGGCVMLLDEAQAKLEPIAAFGRGVGPQQTIKVGEGVIGMVALSGKAELVNDIRADARYVEGQMSTSVRSLVCAPLKSKNRVMGVIALVLCEAGMVHMAPDLKLLNTLASQAAPAIENALLYEKTLREARQREERLHQQIEALRIELDEARQSQKVAEITESDYFQRLRHQADNLREIIEGNRVAALDRVQGE
jgi:putative methionine-R-sulfoxide reductase with GAF domain